MVIIAAKTKFLNFLSKINEDKNEDIGLKNKFIFDFFWARKLLRIDFLLLFFTRGYSSFDCQSQKMPSELETSCLYNRLKDKLCCFVCIKITEYPSLLPV